MEDDDAETSALIDRLIEYYMDIADVYGLMSSVWAMYEIEDFLEVPFPAAETIRLYGEWTTLPAKSTWLDIWRAADMLIWSDVPDATEPRFINDIEPDPENPTELVILLGD